MAVDQLKTTLGAVWNGAPAESKEVVNEQLDEHIYNVPAVDHLYNKLAARVGAVENIGEYLGSFDTFSDLPGDVSDAYFTSATNPRTPNRNDFVTVRDNDNPASGADSAGKQVRYVISNINAGGAITWTEDIVYGTDATDKQDKADMTGMGGEQYIAIFEGTGLQSSKPSAVKLSSAIKGAVRVQTPLNTQIGELTTGVDTNPNGDGLPVYSGSIVYYIDPATGEWTIAAVISINLSTHLAVVQTIATKSASGDTWTSISLVSV
jgi:hypothetical protein